MKVEKQYYPQQAEPRTDIYNGALDVIKLAVTEVLSTHFSGPLHQAMQLGNAAMLIGRIADGSYEVTQDRFTLALDLDK